MREYRRSLWCLTLIGVAALSTSAALAQTDAAPPADPSRQQMRADIGNLKTQARSQIRALLTPDQQTEFDNMKVLTAAPGDHARRGGWGAKAKFHGRGGAGAADGQMGQRILDRLTQKLSLTDQQRASVQTIIDNTRSSAQQLREQAKASFEALLTPDQLAIKKQMHENRGQKGPKAGGRFHQPGGQVGGPLQLTADQKAHAKAIFLKLRADVQQLHADARPQIAALLTPDQQAIFAKLPFGTPRSGKPGMGPGHAGPMRENMILRRLTNRLNLSDTQAADVKTILDNLHTAIQQRIQPEHQPTGG